MILITEEGKFNGLYYFRVHADKPTLVYLHTDVLSLHCVYEKLCSVCLYLSARNTPTPSQKGSVITICGQEIETWKYEHELGVYLLLQHRSRDIMAADVPRCSCGANKLTLNWRKLISCTDVWKQRKPMCLIRINRRHKRPHSGQAWFPWFSEPPFCFWSPSPALLGKDSGQDVTYFFIYACWWWTCSSCLPH